MTQAHGGRQRIVEMNSSGVRHRLHLAGSQSMSARVAWLVSLVFVAILTSLLLVSDTHAVTTVPTKMNFQGRLTDSAGNVKADGTYNMKLRLYTVSTSGSPVWSEDRLVSATQGVTVTNGVFSIQLGSVTTLPASLFASGDLYLSVELPSVATATSSSPSWTEGAMTPRNQLATSAYAYNTETLDGLDSADFGQLTASNSWTGSTFSIGGSANAAKFNVGSIFNVDTAASKITIGASDTTGTVLVLDTKTDAGDPSGTNGAMYYNSNSNTFRCYQNSAWTNCIGAGGSSDADTLDTYDSTAFARLSANNAFTGTTFSIAGTADTAKFNVGSIFNIDTSGSKIAIGASDTTGTVLILDTKTDAGDPSGSIGAMYYNSNMGKFRCYEGSAWRNCMSGAAMSATTATGAWAASAAKGANATILVAPMYIPGPITVNEMRIRITTTLGASGDLGIYDSSGTLVLNGGSASLTAAMGTGVKAIAPTQAGSARVLQAGQYFIAVTWNSTTGIIAGVNMGVSDQIKYAGSLSSGGGTVLPSSITLGSITTGTYLYGMSIND